MEKLLKPPPVNASRNENASFVDSENIVLKKEVSTPGTGICEPALIITSTINT